MTCSSVTNAVASSKIGTFWKKLAREQCFGAIQRLWNELQQLGQESTD